MPVAGRKPKPDGQKRNRVKPTYDWVEVLDVPFRGGPKLPARRPDGRTWPTATKKWWTVVSAMPHCVLWGPGDWEFALASAQLVAEFHDGNMRVAPALLQREKVIGLTVDARRDLRIRYVDEHTVADTDGSVTAIAEYRAMLSG